MEMKPAVRKILKDFNLGKDDVWNCHGSWILLHAACQSIATQLNIHFDKPEVLHYDMDKKQMLVLVRGFTMGKDNYKTLAERWEIGEAAAYNNKNPYPSAMAVKRAEDKIILHLAGLREHGLYSDEEADDFKPKTQTKKGADEKARVETLLREAKDPESVAAIIEHHRSELTRLPVKAKREVHELSKKRLAEFKDKLEVSKVKLTKVGGKK